MGTDALHLRARLGRRGKKCIVALSCFEFQKGKEKKNQKILFITPGINSAYYDQL